MSKIIGIDLGTTNSCVALMEGRDVVVIPNAEGGRITPSMVAFTDSGETLVGHIAKRQAVTNPDSTVFGVKRLIGRKYASPEVQRYKAQCPFAVVPAPNGDAWVKVRDKTYSPPEISAMILRRLKQAAEEYLGEPVTDAVITVPAYFDDAQRQATKDAGRIAGLKVHRIINEPTAAALAYGLDNTRNQKISVYDLGGGTFDVSVLELARGVFDVKATSGDTFLGGEDFDQVLVDWFAGQFKDTTGLDVRGDKYALQRIKEAAEKAKHELSNAEQTQVNLPFIMADDSGPKHLNATITRQKFEELTCELARRTLEPCRQALSDAGLAPGEIDEIILVGGMTRVPMVIREVEAFFGKQAHRGVHPDEVVAVGAAIQAGVLKGDVQEMLLLDVTPLSLGIETLGGVMTHIIERNTTVPTRKAQIFSTTVDSQPLVSVHVLQGEREMARHNKSLSRFDLVGLLPAPRGVPQIEVAFDIDANGILNVSARDLATGRAQSVVVHPTSGLTEDQIQRIVAEAQESETDDKQRRSLADQRIRADTLLYTTRRAIDEYGHTMDAAAIRELNDDIAACESALASDDAAAIKEVLDRLERAAHRITEAIYNSADDDVGGGGGAAAARAGGDSK